MVMVARGAPPVDIASRAPLGLTEPDLATRSGTVLKALPLRMAVLGVSAAQARTPLRAQERRKLAHPALQAGTALQAPLRAKELGLAQRAGTVLQALPLRMVVLGESAVQALTPLRAQERHKLAHLAPRAGTALRALPQA